MNVTCIDIVDGDRIDKIVDRFADLIRKRGEPFTLNQWINTRTSLAFCHAEACSLDLDGLLSSDNFNLVHDVAGIDRHMNRRTFKLDNCFIPRFASKP